jgi:hypothetical protein
VRFVRLSHSSSCGTYSLTPSPQAARAWLSVLAMSSVLSVFFSSSSATRHAIGASSAFCCAIKVAREILVKPCAPRVSARSLLPPPPRGRHRSEQ